MQSKVTNMRTYSIILTAALLSASATQAQIVNDGATNTLSNVTNTFTGDVTVGTNGSFTLVVLSDNSLLTNSGSGIIGLNATARSNEVRLISPSARWRMGGLLFLGSSGSFNQLVVSNGASVSDGGAIISYLAGTSNRALITGSGSTWSNAGPLYHGFTDPGNQLVVSNGGVVFNDVQAFIGVGSSNNLAVVTGSGSTWTTASDLGVGLGSVGNQLMISNGGAVKNGHGYVGVNPAASNNLASITGAGSVWSNALDLEVGSSEGNNQMIVSSGATVFTASNGLIGSFTNANGNSVTLTDPGTRWWVGNNLYVGSNGALSSLIVSNGAFVHDSSATLGNLAASSNNISLVTGGGSTWSNANNLDIGGFGRGNQLIVSNGGWVAVNRDARLGVNVSSSNNLALVTGVGSVWSNGIGLRVGNIAPGNRLVIEAGGLVIDDTGTVGDFNSASNNEALVTGPGSLWTNHSFLTIGNQIGRNQLIVSNGATVWSGTGSVGSSSNQVVVTGVGSVWSNQTFLLVGGAGDRVDVSDGGWLECNDGYVGQGFSANSNTVALSGVGSGWNNLAGLVVGDGGSGNALIASNGATVLSSNATIGASTSLGNNNFALLTGAGTMWSNRNDFTVGNFSFGNRLVVSNQATVATSNLFVGFQSASASNRVTADGGTLRANLLDVRHGAATVNAGLMDVDFLRLTNTQGQFEFNGGTLISRGALITSSGLFTVGNSGTNPALWDVRAGASNHFVANHVSVGSNSSFNQVLIGNGAVLTNNGNGIFGFNSGANSNAATVAGAGSQWRPAGDFFVGSAGSFNRLVVSNAGWVVNGTGFMGNSAGANNNEVQVTGPGATWSNRTDVVVGFSGSGNFPKRSESRLKYRLDSFGVN